MAEEAKQGAAAAGAAEAATLREEAFLDLVDRDTFLLLLDFFRV